VIDPSLIQAFLQDTNVAIVVNSNISSIGAAEDYNIPVPAVIPTYMSVAVRPAPNSEDKFWLGQVESLRTEQPLVYNLRYYSFNKAKKGWFLMRGTGAYGWVAHTAIIAAGIEFNADKSMKAVSIRLITKALHKD
jgi:hypothetical protein